MVQGIIAGAVALLTAIIGAVHDSQTVSLEINRRRKNFFKVLSWLEKNQRTIATYTEYFDDPRSYHTAPLAGWEDSPTGGAPKDPAKYVRRKAWVLWSQGLTGNPGAFHTPTPPSLAGYGLEQCYDWLRESWSMMMAVYPILPQWNAQFAVEARHVVVIPSTILDQEVVDALYPNDDGHWPLSLQDYTWNQTVRMYGAGLLAPTETIDPQAFNFNEREQREHGFDNANTRRTLFGIGFLTNLYTILQAQVLAGVAYAGVPAYGAVGEIPTDMHDALIYLAQNPLAVAAVEETTPTRALPPILQRTKKEWPSGVPKPFPRTDTELGEDLAQENADAGTDPTGEENPDPNYIPLLGAAAFFLATHMISRRK